MLKKLKYSLIRLIEKNSFIHLLVYNNISHFSFLFPHDKDYLGLKLLFKRNINKDFLDIGGNIGLSTIGFRSLGFKKNRIYIFEPNTLFCKKYLINLKKKLSNITIFNFGLSSKSHYQYLYIPYFKKRAFHFWASCEKEYIKNKILDHYPEYLNQFFLKKKKIKFKKFDDIRKKFNICFIKVDVEGHDYEVLLGMKKFLKKNNPVFLIEYNFSNFKNIYFFLKKNYNIFIYKSFRNKFYFLKKKDIRNLKNGTFFKNNLKSERNIYFIPKGFKKINNARV